MKNAEKRLTAPAYDGSEKEIKYAPRRHQSGNAQTIEGHSDDDKPRQSRQAYPPECSVIDCPTDD